MNIETVDNGHRKFLKGRAFLHNDLLGQFFPSSLQLRSETDATDFTFLTKRTQGTFCFIMSSTCSYCNYHPIESFVRHFPDFDYMLLLEGHQSFLEEVIDKNNFRFPIYSCNIVTINHSLRGIGVPWVLVLNGCGQIIGTGAFNTTMQIQMIAQPLIRTFYASREILDDI
ncbi:hypothetical protein FHS16_004138 [Paenibacillus endophyticus]|uniref:Thioredoxin domain-containing protein n=1 Tax=Paenibacillus endophyticus TaxID=1294268 RepID=A0A7W5GCJ3_9BACL|nr:hypothetical protein [Paenibacillus endophyticus]MBB3154062.1 hypothetical protein [Paenibacillus endophyticus]